MIFAIKKRWLLLAAAGVLFASVVLALIFFSSQITLTSLDFGRGTLEVPELRLSWNVRTKGSPHIMLHAPEANLIGGGKALEARVTLMKGANAFSAEKVRFGRVTLEDVRGTFTWDWKKMRVNDLRFRIAGQTVAGSGTLTPGQPAHYEVSLASESLPAQAMIDAFDWRKKVSMSGIFRGRMEAEGLGKNLLRLEGMFGSMPPGGEIVILDQEFLRKIADNTRQPIEIVKASFENYRYNTGQLRLTLDRRDLRLYLDLDGDAGKRNLEVNLHDLFPES